MASYTFSLSQSASKMRLVAATICEFKLGDNPCFWDISA